MANVLIVGNITKDIYLRLDPTQNNFEQDHHKSWLDLPFDGSSTNYSQRTSIYGGAAITYEILKKFDHTAEITGVEASYDNGAIQIPQNTASVYRYILSSDNTTHYFRPVEIATTLFSTSSAAPDLVYLDRSVELDRELCEKLLSYLSLATSTKLAMFISKRTDTAKDYIQKLITKADFTFSDTDQAATYHISPTNIISGDHSVSWTPGDKQNLMTDLTTHSIIAATILAAHLQGRTLQEQLLQAKYNAENSSLNGTLSAATLKEKTMDQAWQVKSIESLRTTAKKLLAPNKGILAADESGGSIHKKFESMNIPDDEQHRRDYRNIFFTTPDLEKYTSGIILFDETARQHADDGTDFPSFIAKRGIIPGVKVDQGLEQLPTGETLTKGLDGLPARLEEYFALGLRFAKWRAAFTAPSDTNIAQNCDRLAQYAKDCQNAGIVPIVEPELVYDGDYTIEQSATLTTKILKQLVKSLTARQVDLSATIIKTNMVLAGKQQARQSTPEEVGKTTAEVLRTTLPDNIAGVVFLSGGQSVTQATDNLQAVINNGPFPWPVTFSFARALQDPALNAWKGDNHNADVARQAFLARLIANAQALTKK